MLPPFYYLYDSDIKVVRLCYHDTGHAVHENGPKRGREGEFEV